MRQRGKVAKALQFSMTVVSTTVLTIIIAFFSILMGITQAFNDLIGVIPNIKMIWKKFYGTK